MNQDDASKKLTRVILVIPITTVIVGIGITVMEPHYGLLTVALILGWTQLVGL